MRGKPCPSTAQMRAELHNASGGSDNNFWRDRATEPQVIAEYVRLDGCILAGGGDGDGNGNGGYDILKQITDFVKENPIIVGGVVLLLFLMKGRR